MYTVFSRKTELNDYGFHDKIAKSQPIWTKFTENIAEQFCSNPEKFYQKILQIDEIINGRVFLVMKIDF